MLSFEVLIWVAGNAWGAGTLAGVGRGLRIGGGGRLDEQMGSTNKGRYVHGLATFYRTRL